jgi:predicted nucleic acid-binding protein
MEVRSRGSQFAVSTSVLEMLDSNVLIYAFSTDPRADTADRLLRTGCVISVQALNEFTNVARRKMGMTWDEIREAVSAIQALCRPAIPLEIEAHPKAIAIAERYQLSFFDALMIAVGLMADCGVLWSEDMQDGLLIEGKLQIRNPFR